MYIYIYAIYTLPKTKMTMENQPFESMFLLFFRWWFHIAILVFGGVYIYIFTGRFIYSKNNIFQFYPVSIKWTNSRMIGWPSSLASTYPTCYTGNIELPFNAWVLWCSYFLLFHYSIYMLQSVYHLPHMIHVWYIISKNLPTRMA